MKKKTIGDETYMRLYEEQIEFLQLRIDELEKDKHTLLGYNENAYNALLLKEEELITCPSYFFEGFLVGIVIISIAFYVASLLH